MRVLVRRACHYLPAVGIAMAYARFSRYADPLADLTSETKGAMYQTFASIAGTVLGLGVVSFSVLFAVSPKSRLAAVIAFSTVLRVWLTGAFVVLGIALVGFGVLLPLDATDRPSVARYVAVGLVVAVATALGELIYLADRIFRTLSRQVEAELATQPSADFSVVEPDDKESKVPTR